MMRHPLILLVRVYQWTIAPILPPRCRFMPSCSQYMIDALTAYGSIRGTWMGTRRILRCNPLCEGGVDPVPQPRESVDSVNQKGRSTDTAAFSERAVD